MIFNGFLLKIRIGIPLPLCKLQTQTTTADNNAVNSLFSFKKQEQYFNKYDHYRTNIEGIDVHFVHVKPKLKPGQKAKPLLISHGWPGSFYEFHKVLS